MTRRFLSKETLTSLSADIKTWGQALGFEQVAISNIDLGCASQALEQWIAKGRHGEMQYMERHVCKRTHPEQLVVGTEKVICVTMNYLPRSHQDMWKVLFDRRKAYISSYALGRDYHKMVRKRLQKLQNKMLTVIEPQGYRVFCDSAPVMEKPLAAKAGLGWIGKHTNLLNRDDGSWFFLGEIYTDLPLPVDHSVKNHCGTCEKCIRICPTDAIVSPYQLDARRCISYLTIELKGEIPLHLRTLIGNRIFGCDDCQLICPWNRFAKLSSESDFRPRHQLDQSNLSQLFDWTEEDFRRYTEGSAIRRIGYTHWLRNIAIALGNAPTSQQVVDALKTRVYDSEPLVRTHVTWALNPHGIEN